MGVRKSRQRKGVEWVLGIVATSGVLGLSGCSTVVPAPVGETPAARPVIAPVVPPTSGKPAETGHAKPATAPLTWAWPLAHEPGIYHPKTLGVDVVVRKPMPVVAAADGVVSYVGDGIASYGLMVIIKHPDDYVSVYAQNARVLVRQGQVVTQGQKIAETAGTGTRGKPWHFEIRHGGKSLDPRNFFPGNVVK